MNSRETKSCKAEKESQAQEIRQASSLSPKEALQLGEGEKLLHQNTVVIVEKVEEGFGLLEEGEAMIWAAPEGGQGRGISVT